MMSIRRFYGQPEHLLPVVSIIRGISGPSLRLIEWFITNHAKKRDVILVRKGDQINVHHSYRSALKTFSKEQFDPFRRHERIRFVYGDGADDSIETTVGQLNFFKWAVETGVLDYITTNRTKIEGLMVDSGASKSCCKRRAAEGLVHKDTEDELSGIHHRVKTTLSFD
jgi:hypothetical protein